MKIHYIAQYGENVLGRKLTYSPAGQAKMNYIVDALLTTGSKLRIFSTCAAGNNAYYKCKKTKTRDKYNITYCSTFNSSIKYINLIDILFRQLQLFFYLLLLVKRNDTVMVYHERFYLPVIALIRKFKTFKLMYEVEEIYTLAAKYPQKKVLKEINGLKNSDAYIFPNDLMADYLSFNDKPFVVCYGSYHFEDVNVQKFDDGKIHLVYAGTLDTKKGGASTAVELGKCLDEKFHIHILGFGNKGELFEIKSKIDSISKEYKTIITYDGMLTGVEYRNFIQKCHVGLSTQNPEGEYNNTSFPSKILTYLSNDIFVLSTRLKILEYSQLNDMLTYYDLFYSPFVRPLGLVFKFSSLPL